jgi:hypothetical protein
VNTGGRTESLYGGASASAASRAFILAGLLQTAVSASYAVHPGLYGRSAQPGAKRNAAYF